MSTTPTPPTPLEYALTHVFLPVQLPEANHYSDYTLENDFSLLRTVCDAARAYSTHIDRTSEPQWSRIRKMLDNLAESEYADGDHIVSQLRGMQREDILTYFIRSHYKDNTAIVLTKQENDVLFEILEAPSEDAVGRTPGPLICSYPGSAVNIPNGVFSDRDIQSKLANFLSRRSGGHLGLHFLSSGSQFINARLMGISQDVGPVTEFPSIIKRVRHDVVRDYRGVVVWRRSSLWLLIRVAIQTSFDRSSSGRASYKQFMLFFICTLARSPDNAKLSSDDLHLMSSKIFRRLCKLGSSPPIWLSEMAKRTCTDLQEILDARWKELGTRPSPFRNPTEDELRRDTQISLPNSREYIRNALENRVHDPSDTSFHPSHCHRGTLNDFLSSDGTFFEEAYKAEPDVTLYDVDQSVEQGIDDWLACVTNVEEACSRIEILMDKYIVEAVSRDQRSPENKSITFLTAIELFVALDKLIVKQIPMLTDYSPEIPVAFLEKLYLCNTASLHRLSCVYQYLSARHSQSRPGWSILSNEYTQDSFVVRYFDRSPYLQCLKARIERDAMEKKGCIDLQQGAASRTERTHDGYEDLAGHELADHSEACSSPLPTSPLLAKAIVFELQCPVYIRTWRSAVSRVLLYYHRHDSLLGARYNLLAHDPALQSYSIPCKGSDRSPVTFQTHIAYSHTWDSHSRNNLTLCFVSQCPHTLLWDKDDLVTWQSSLLLDDEKFGSKFGLYQVEIGILWHYINYPSYTPNDVLSAQVDCPTNLSLDDFISFGHLRSDRSLQWFNILNGLRSRSLNLCRDDVHLLLTNAAFQAGPLDLNTGIWLWHQELQNSSFCNLLLDELGSLFVNVGSSIDAVMMSTISLLLTRVLASSPSEGVSERAIELLGAVRKKTFGWVQDLSYDLDRAPGESFQHDHLFHVHNIATSCRSTFDVGVATLCKIFQICRSTEDIDALLFCAFLIPATDGYGSDSPDGSYSMVLRERGFRVSLSLEGFLREQILSDPSDYSVDLAISKFFPAHKPSVHRWEQLQHLNASWLTCRTRETSDRSSQTLHFNLHNGRLQVDGEPWDGLPHEARRSSNPGDLRRRSSSPRWPEPSFFPEIFCDQGFFPVPSNLPGMDFMTRTIKSKYKLHYSLRGRDRRDLVVQAQCDETDEILELIPLEIMEKDLPMVLARPYTHWLNLSTRIIEIRPLARLWEQSFENWMIDCSSEPYHIYKGHETLVDIQSPTWAMFSKCFQCLNYLDPNDLLVTVSSTDHPKSIHLSVALPYYGLSFFVNEQGELESRDFKNMVYDEDQSVGTLFGLENLLVLRQESHLAPGLIPRRVLIPSGFPLREWGSQVVKMSSSQRDTTGPIVKVSFTNRPTSQNHAWAFQIKPYCRIYKVDTELGCLVADDSMSMLYLANLHAVTNCDRPDPLMGKTGAQAALGFLRSAGCRSIMLKPVIATLPTPNQMWSPTWIPQVESALSDEVVLRDSWYQCYSHTIGSFRDRDYASESRAARRAAYLFPLALDAAGPSDDKHDPCTISPPRLGYHTSCRNLLPQIMLDRLLSTQQAPDLPSRSALQGCSYQVLSANIPDLKQLLSSLEHISEGSKSFRRGYLSCLNTSAQYIHRESQVTKQLAEENRIEALKEHYLQCRVKYMGALVTLEHCLGPNNPHERELVQFGQWHWSPLTADVLLRYLASTSPIDLSREWKRCLMSLALLLLDVQRARRLLRFAMDGPEEEFLKELENEGCDRRCYEDHPDWLLIQIQGDFLIRPTQVDTAREMILPGTRSNSVMQVNMGEGKSSVIIPITASALADGKQLVRVIVPKALTVQMFELLVSRLGGLANRPIYHLPFSRSVVYDHNGKISLQQIEDLRRLMTQCMADHGILLVQPEHVVSLKLMAVEQQIKLVSNTPESPKSAYAHIMTAMSFKPLPQDYLVNVMFQRLSKWLCNFSNGYTNQADRCNKHGEEGAAAGASSRGSGSGTPESNNGVFAGGKDLEAHVTSNKAAEWLRLQKWIHSHARDILDESDEILHARFQLIYTIGLEQHMDGYPNRWTITQNLLQLAKNHADSLSNSYPDSIQYECGPPGSFPHLRIVRASEGGRKLIDSIVEDVMAGRLPGFNLQQVSPGLHVMIRSFISEEDIISTTAQNVEQYAKGSHQSHMWSGLLLLRGLLACNVLLFSLSERRWRVDYGLVPDSPGGKSPTSTMLAVPYRAKDVPAPGTQFGHPDIAIILTCLSYHYAGLSKEQLRTSFTTMLNEDDPITEYSSWVKEYDPESVPDSLRELGEMNLNPSEQWDKMIFPLFSRNHGTIDFYLSRMVFPKEAKEFPLKISGSSWDLAEKREKLVTGFSGTNDSRWLLPMSIAQRDLDHQRGTNARVLGYLLGPENNSYMVTHESGEPWSTPGLLRMVTTQQPEIRVLLDVGAQVLDFSNLQVATAWLDIAPRDIAGAIHFNEQDELMVLTRNGTTQSMLSSPLSQQLGRCVVYLDHAHTRGTDIKIPIGTRAAVILGPKVTKDSLVQGCMRMRKLGRGHSVMFFAPPEVDGGIRAVSRKKELDAQITTADILCWAIWETWIDIQQRAPYWAQQGMNHKLRYDAWNQFCNDEIGPKHLSDAWLQPDYKSLTELYAPPSCGTPSVPSTLSDNLDPAIHQRCRDLEVKLSQVRSARMEEEQEREVNREREREREVELPPRARAAKHHLHQDVITFVNTGYIPPLQKDSAFLPVFEALEKSSADTSEVKVWSRSILATMDFCTTVIPESTEGTMDQYLRPVQWILSRTNTNHGKPLLVLVSPFEAGRLLPAIRVSEHVHLHLYAPRTSQRMEPSDDLKFYSIPPLPSDWTPPWDLIDQLNIFAGQLYLRDHQSYLRVCQFLRVGVPTKQVQNNTTFQLNSLRISGSFKLEENENRFIQSPMPFVMALLAIRTRGKPFDHTHMGRILQGQQLTVDDFREFTSARASLKLASCNTRTLHDGTRDIVPPSPSDMDCDTPKSPAIVSSASLLSSKRRVEMSEESDVDPGPSKKRPRLDRQ